MQVNPGSFSNYRLPNTAPKKSPLTMTLSSSSVVVLGIAVVARDTTEGNLHHQYLC